MARKGILLDESDDLMIHPKRDESGKIVSGLVVDVSDEQNARLIVEAQKGQFKEYPTLGFNVQRFLKKTTIARQQFIRELTVELQSDNIKVKSINVSSDLQTFNIEIK